MKFFAVFTSFVLCSLFAHAQVGFKGKVIDQSTGKPLKGAHIVLDQLLSGTYSDESGNFELKGLKNKEYRVSVMFIGYKTLIDTISPNGNNILELTPSNYFISTVEITSLRVGENSPFTKNEVSKEEIQKQNLGADLPILLNQTPSVVVNSDAGAGVGYTGIRIRGTDGTRINATINGIPVNDAESQGVFWVNTPDLASSVQSIQIQRGAGTSTNGAGAFGASININTNDYRDKAYAEISNSYGSFNTWKHTLKAGTGLLANHFTFDARLSKISSDGFINRATSDLKSFYVSGAYYGKNTNIRVNVFSGREKTYQAWNGIAQNVLDTNRTYNSCGTEKPGKPYENETDNYGQDYYQIFLNQRLGKYFTLNTALHATKGKGYYEQYKAGETFSSYGLSNPVVGSDTITSTDLIRQLWLDNWFYGGIFNLAFKHDKWDVTLGGGLNRYDGKHYGKIIWAQNSQNLEKDQKWYQLTSRKTDFNIYLKTKYQVLPKLYLFADLQYRDVTYQINGFRYNPTISQNNHFQFFNPKGGITWMLGKGGMLYGSFAKVSKEPNRDDFEAGTNQTPKFETLRNVEVGYERKSKRYAIAANIYYMNYKNQLVLTGKINDVGAYTRTNIPNSYRLGLELQGSVKFLKYLNFAANLTLSRNRILDFTEYLDDYDNGGQIEIKHGETDIAFSPSVIGGATLGIEPIKMFHIEFLTKYVGRQMMDNTSDKSRSLAPFLVNDFRMRYSFKLKVIKEIGFNLMLNNIFNVKYAPNGYTYSYIYGGQTQTENFYYPQAGRNFMIGMNLVF